MINGALDVPISDVMTIIDCTDDAAVAAKHIKNIELYACKSTIESSV